jgi:hypothetical protein
MKTPIAKTLLIIFPLGVVGFVLYMLFIWPLIECPDCENFKDYLIRFIVIIFIYGIISLIIWGIIKLLKWIFYNI